tara:strand:- start:304 stop:681 length:378 start_codon:yes stop_codon:yes gene_type:complete
MKTIITTLLLLAATFTQAQDTDFWEIEYNPIFGEDISNFVCYEFSADKDAWWIMVVRIVSEEEHVPYALRGAEPEAMDFHFFCPGDFYAVAIDKYYNEVSIPWYFSIDDDSPKYDDVGAVVIDLK